MRLRNDLVTRVTDRMITLEAMRTHFRVVSALMIREVASRFGNKPGGYLWALLDPSANILFLTLIFMAITRVPALGTSFPLFFATGYVAFQFYQTTVSFINNAVKINKPLLSYPNVAPIDAVMARFLLQILTTSMVAVVVFTVLSVMERNPITINWSLVLMACLCASVIALGLGMMNTVIFLKYPVYEQVFSIISKPLYLISGIFFLPDAIPHPYREVLLYSPLVHVIMLFRQGFYPQYRAIGLDTDYLYAVTILVFVVGMTLFSMSTAVLRGR